MRILIILFLLSPFQLHAQTAEDSIKQVITDFFSALKRSDTASMRLLLSPAMHLETMQAIPGTEPNLRIESPTSFLTRVAQTDPGMCDERIRFEVVQSDDAIAIVWTPYEFYFNGRFSHCGVNSFTLIRQRGNWLIQYLIDTRRKNCKPS